MRKYLTSFIVLSLLMFANLASAAIFNHDISTGCLTIPASSTNEYVITGSTTSNYVVVEFGWKGTITLKNCYFDFYDQYNSPIRITGKDNLSNSDPSRTNVNLILDGDNYIYNEYGNGNACIQVDQGAQINISAIEPCDNSSGTLIAEQKDTGGGAAIGARISYNTSDETYSTSTLNTGSQVITAGGNIVVSSGTITAKGGHGAGIGGGHLTWYDGMIVIYGGIVNASATAHAAGIGSGCPLGSGVEKEYTTNSAIIALPPAQITAVGAKVWDPDPSLGLAGTNVRVYIGDPNQPAITVRTVDYTPNANIYFDLSQDPDINRVVSSTIDPSVLNINNVLLGQTDSQGVFKTTGSLMNPTTFFTDATNSSGNPYLAAEETLPSGGSVALGVLEADFNIRQIPSNVLEYGYSHADAQQVATAIKISYNDSKPMTDVRFDMASGASSKFASPIYLASDSLTIVSAPTTLKKGDVYYVVIPIKDGLEARIHSDVFRVAGKWNGSPTGYLRQVISQIVAEMRKIVICEGDSYFFNGENLTKEGIYVAVGSESSVCATSAVLNDAIKLEISSPTSIDVYDTICDAAAYNWEGESYTTSGVYTKVLTNQYGCDSTVTLHLIVSTSYDHKISDTICAGEVYSWDDVQYTTTGSYSRKYISMEGCDSIVTLNLTVAETYDIEFTDTICAGETYRWNSEKYTESGSYTQSFTTQYGCDSIVTLHLIVGDLYNVEWSDTICDGEVLVWNDSNYVKTGYYTQSFVSRYGCDSIVTLHLTVGDLYDVSIYDTICVDETYTWDGMQYATTGVYPRMYRSRYGCDSLVTLHLTVGEKYNIEFADTICEDEVYVWNKVRYTESGSYTQELKTVHGCDSIVTVHLFVAPIVYESYAEAVCKDEPYYFGGNILVKPGVYVDTAVSMYGCDSITVLSLRIHEPYLIDQYIEACHNDTFMFRGMLIDEPGIYYDSMLTQHGCDSVYRLIYNKTPTYMFQEEDSICVGSTYNFRGMTLTKPGVYYDSLSTVSGCDSIYKLVLHNFSHSDIYSIEVADVCGDNQSLQLVAHYEGQRPEYYNIIYSKEANAQGFKNIIQVPFTTDTIEAPMPNATPYIHPDYYELTLQLGNYKCPKSVSEHTTDFLVRYPSWIIEQNWQDVVAVLNAQHNGGYTFENYEWYVNNQPASQNKSYLYLPTLRVGDEVELHVMRKGEDYYVPTCSIIIEEQDAYNQDHPTLATPAKVSRNNRQVSLEAQAASTQYYLYDIAGRCLLEGVCEYGQVQHFELPTVAGSYFLTMVDAENRKQTIHMVVD